MAKRFDASPTIVIEGTTTHVYRIVNLWAGVNFFCFCWWVLVMFQQRMEQQNPEVKRGVERQ